MKFYHEEFQRKLDAEKYRSKKAYEIHLSMDHVELELKNITYQIDHRKIILKSPFRVHSNKK